MKYINTSVKKSRIIYMKNLIKKYYVKINYVKISQRLIYYNILKIILIIKRFKLIILKYIIFNLGKVNNIILIKLKYYKH